MNKAYILGPLAALLLFGGTYWSFQSGYHAREAAREAQLHQDQKAKIQAETEARRVAIEEALVVQVQRKKEREENETREKAAREIRQVAIDERDRVFREQEKTTREIQRVKKDLAEEQAALVKIAESRKASLAEQAFLRDFVKKAEANARNLETVLNQFVAAEAARVAAAAAAATAARK